MFYLRLLLALAFALGQSFALAHATLHELDTAGKAFSCEICAVAHSGGGLPGSAPTPPALSPVFPAPEARQPAAPAERFLYRPPSRGPPSNPI